MVKMYDYVCEKCGKSFSTPHKKKKEHFYCTIKCFSETLKKNKIEKICPICNKKFYAYPYEKDRKYCSKECLNISRKGKPNDAKRKYKFLETTADKNSLYKKWRSIKNRLFMPSCDRYKNYAERGIKMCKEWLDFKNFYDWAMANGYHDNLTIDRIDVNGNYEPSNCRWIPMVEQAKNKTTNIRIIYKGQETILSEVAEMEKLDKKAIYGYYHRYKDINIVIQKMKANNKTL